MSEKINSYCTICGKGYHVCLSCSSHKFTPWKAVTDTSEHYKIHQILSGYNMGVYTKAEAKSKLDKVVLTDKETYKDNIKNIIDEIMGTDETQETVKPSATKKSTKRKKNTQTVETE